MLTFYVDFNYREDVDVVIVRLDVRLNSDIPEQQMKPGLRVTLYDETLECQAILQEGNHAKWVAKLLRDTIRHIPEDQWNRLESPK